VKTRFIIRTPGGEMRASLETEGLRTVLDAMELLRSGTLPSLSYRHSCHHGSCGTCGALVNGKPSLMCLTRLDSLDSREILVEPLSSLTWIAGIAVFPGLFFERLPDTDYLHYEEPTKADVLGTRQAILEKCIECGLCVESCPVEKPFVGPAALAAAELELEKHQSRISDMVAFAAGADGARACERAFACSRACPQGVAPGKKITELLKRL